jgi:hypothetical protein
MEPYVVRQGEYLLKIAYKFGFDADTIWNDPKNDDLRTLRPNPNILLAGDLLYIPDQVDKQPSSFGLVTGSTNTFSVDPPTVPVTVEFVDTEDTSYASRAYTIKELDRLTGLQTDGQGVVTFDAPVTLDEATVVFTDTGETWVLAIGCLDPVDTLSGMFQRLQSLGRIGATTAFDADDSEQNFDILRQGLQSLEESTSEDGDADASASDDDAGASASDDDAGASDGDDDADASDGDDDADASASDDDADASDGDDDADASDGDDDADASASDDDALDSEDDSADDAGLDDEGKLDKDAADRLVDAFGS